MSSKRRSARDLDSAARKRHRPGRVMTAIALLGAFVLLAHATWRIVSDGAGAFRLEDALRSDFLVRSAIPAILLAPLLVLAFQRGQRGSYRACGLLLVWGALLTGLALLVPRGIYASGWFLVPVLVLLVTCTFGAIPGVAQAAVAVFAVLAAAELTQGAAGLPGVWSHAAFAGVAVVLMALLGSLLQHTLSLAISAEEDQNERMDEARRALRHRENLLRHAMRIDTVGEMASMVVHQLRNQFQLVMGYAAVGRQSAPPDTAEHFQSIVVTLEQSNDLLEGLLGMSRREAGRIEVVDVARLCAQACENYRRVLPSNIVLQVDLPQAPVPVRLDPQGLEHALLNLVINARQAIRGDGTIHVRLRIDDAVAELEVADDGSGIEPELLGQIFKPFFTTKRKGEGTGLGLAAVQRFVRSSRGDVSVQSEPGAGTVFSLRFPLAALDDLRAG